ncbi:MAG TPA: ABC transporter substrate-binding protein [Bryobacteraceae bacterium]|nr:ABC transporter substrate-binding protein [Bryobacteraceae bacterium]
MHILKMIGIVTLPALIGSGCASPKKPPLRLGVNFWATTEFILMAQEKHFFEEEGLPVEIVEYSSLNDLRRGFERGQVDAMASSLVEVLMVRDNTQRRPQVVLIVDFSNGADFIVAKYDIPNVAGLKKRRVGVEGGSMGIFVLGRALEQAGLTFDDVTLISKDQSTMERSYLSGEIDAAVTYPPFSVGLGGTAGDGHLIFSSKQIPGEIVDIVAVDVNKLNPGDAAKFQNVWKRVTAHVAANSGESYRIMAKREKISLADFQATMDGLQIVSHEQQRALFEQGGLKVTVQKTARFLQQTGVLKRIPDPDDLLALDHERISLRR